MLTIADIFNLSLDPAVDIDCDFISTPPSYSSPGEILGSPCQVAEVSTCRLVSPTPQLSRFTSFTDIGMNSATSDSQLMSNLPFFQLAELLEQHGAVFCPSFLSV